ncbi:MAG: helix-turn-helix transcriptional regulator [Pyrinomonadaceae bacterium]|nr:helix-turn-helix transcriptional regulator [Pyrinomonadaceae bacterium]
MDRRIQTVRFVIETDFRRAWDIEALAQMINLSASRLRHLFTAEIGQTPAQYLKAVRMREAEMLLRTTLLSVKEIMNRVGISNESHFVHDFKKAHGLAPSKYRSAATVTASVESGSLGDNHFRHEIANCD